MRVQFVYWQLDFDSKLTIVSLLCHTMSSGADPAGGAPGAHPPKIGGNMIFFWRKIVIFHTKYPKNLRASLRNWKKYDFLA